MPRRLSSVPMPPAAILFALVTIFLWSFLALLASFVPGVPPFLMVGITLTISGLAGAVRFKDWKVSLTTWFVGIGGLFGYHFLIFTAFRYSPPLEANLINYLWPLLIVVLSPLILTGYSLRPHHWAGALMGLAGTVLIASGGKLQLDWANLPGYLCAAGAALTWACYSLMTKRLPPFPTGAVGGFCLVSGLLSLALYAFQVIVGGFTPVLLTRQDWFFLILMGIGPLGTAFFTWDAALKRGDPRVIGSLTYMTPLLSTFNLVVLGGLSLAWYSGASVALIVGGAVVSALDIWKPHVK